MRAAVLQFESGADYGANLDRLTQLVKSSDADLVLAPEVCLTGFDYDRFEAAAAFAEKSEAALLALSEKCAIALTRIEREGDAFFNVFRLYDGGRCVHTQKKHKLFLLGNEHDHFSAGAKEAIAPFEWRGWRVGVLICFELRFSDLWRQLEGCELILVPAAWGRLRKSHYEKLCDALAIVNRCFVAASDSADADMAAGSAIISPWGEALRDDTQSTLTTTLDKREITKMKRAIPYDTAA